MSMTIQSSVKDKILATSSETSKVENAPAEMLRDLDQQMEKRADDGCTLWIKLYSKYEYEIRYHPEFEVGDRVMLKVSPWKGVIRFGKKGKLAPSLPVSLDEIEVDKILCFVEEPVKNSDYEVMRLKCSRMVVVKVHLGSKRGRKISITLIPLNFLDPDGCYYWSMRRKLNHREDVNGGISNFTGRIKGMHVFIGNFTYVVDFMVVEDISSIIDHRLSQVVLGRPFIKISNMTHDLPDGVVRNKEDKIRGVDYVMSKILGFYKEYLELGPEYVTGLEDEGEVTLYLRRRSLEVLRKFHWMILGGRFNQLLHVSSLLLSKPGEY
ncbi:retrotransposon ORF1 [Tanacetum coccineum]